MEELMRHPAPLFLQQDMRDFELYGTVDATVCCLDSLNYLCDDGDLLACLKCIHLYLAPGGLLVFDVNSPHKFASTYGSNAYILEDEDEEGRAVFCGWQNEYDPESRLCKFYLSLFTEEEDGRYTRSDEEQTERCYDEADLRAALDGAGFDLCGIYADFDFSPVTETTERWYVVARTRKVGDWYLCEKR
jgi:SAM-dependent methyltransferase